MAEKKLNLSIILRAVDQATAPIKRLNGQLQAMNAPVKRLSFEMGKFARLSGLSAVKTGLADVGREATALAAKVTALGAGLGYLFKRQFIDPSAEFERLTASLESIEGSSEKARQSLAWITEFAKNTPLTLQQTTSAFTLLKTVGIDPTSGALQALVDHNAKIGGTQENLIEISRQLGQAWMKNKLQGEEVVTLLERQVPIVGLLARAYGKSEAEVQVAISKGQIGRKAMIKLFQQMGKEAEGASERQAKTWDGLTSRLEDSWDSIRRTIMGSGPFQFLKDRLEGLVTQLDAFLKSAEGTRKLRELGRNLERWFLDAESGVKTLWRQIDRLAKSVGGFGALAKYALGGVALVITGPLLASIAQLVAALAVSPFGVLIAGATAATAVLTGMLDPVEQLLPLQMQRIVLKIRRPIDDLLKGIITSFRSAFGWAMPDSALAGTSKMLRDIDDRRRRLFRITAGLSLPEMSSPRIAAPATVPTESPFTGAGSRQTVEQIFARALRQNAGEAKVKIEVGGSVPTKVKSLESKGLGVDVDAGLMGAAW